MNCIECGKPWGVILDRGEEPSPDAEKLARNEMPPPDSKIAALTDEEYASVIALLDARK